MAGYGIHDVDNAYAGSLAQSGIDCRDCLSQPCPRLLTSSQFPLHIPFFDLVFIITAIPKL